MKPVRWRWWLLPLLIGCAPYRPAPRGEFDIVYAPGGRAEVVRRADGGGKERVLVRRPDLPGRGLPIVVAVGNVAVFEPTARVRDVELAGRAAEAWFTPGKHLYIRGVRPGSAQLRLRFADGHRDVLRVEVR